MAKRPAVLNLPLDPPHAKRVKAQAISPPPTDDLLGELLASGTRRQNTAATPTVAIPISHRTLTIVTAQSPGVPNLTQVDDTTQVDYTNCWLKAKPKSEGNWEDTEQQEQQRILNDHEAMNVWQHQTNPIGFPHLRGPHGHLTHPGTSLDKPSQAGQKPFDSIEDAAQLDVKHLMRMPMYTACNLIRGAATMNCTPRDIIKRITEKPTRVAYALPSYNMCILLPAQPPMRVGHSPLW